MIHFLQVAIAGLGFLVICLGAVLLIVKKSNGKGMDEEEKIGKIRRLYPHIPDPEDAQIENNTPEWKIKRSQAN